MKLSRGAHVRLSSSAFHILLLVAGAAFLLADAFHGNVWFDESYSVGIANHSFADIWYYSSGDVHPVLIYWALHVLNLVFGQNITIYRLFTVAGAIAMAVLGYTHVRRDHGWATGVLFSFFALFTPYISLMAVEIRMYSWATFAVMLCFIYAMRIIGTQLQGGPRAPARSGIGQADGLERAEARRIDALAGDLLDGLASLEQIARLEFAANHAIGVDQLLDERLVFLTRERRVQVVAHLAARILVAALAEQLAHVQRIGHDDRRRRVVERHMVRPRDLGKRFRQSIGGQRTGRHDDGIGALAGLLHRAYLRVLQVNPGVLLDALRYLAGERLAIDRKGAAGRHGVIKGGGVHLRAERGKLGFQHARRAFRLRALQAVRADQLGAQAGFVHGRSLFGAHFHKADREPSVR